MKFLNYVVLFTLLGFLTSCSVDEPQIEIPTVEVEQRSCLDNVAGQLDIFVDVMQGQSNGSQTPNNGFVAWNNLLHVLQGCGINVNNQILFYTENGWSCDNIGGAMDAQAGSPKCENAAIMAAKANCYMREWRTSGGTDKAALQSFKTSFCDMLLAIESCLDIGLNVDGYCNLIGAL